MDDARDWRSWSLWVKDGQAQSGARGLWRKMRYVVEIYNGPASHYIVALRVRRVFCSARSDQITAADATQRLLLWS